MRGNFKKLIFHYQNHIQDIKRMSTTASTSSSKNDKILIFDLDGCLYDANCGYVEHIRSNVFKFMVNKEWCSTVEEAKSIWTPLFKQYNQTKRGLRANGYKFDDKEYWAYVREGASEFISKDESLSLFLNSITNSKYIMTNCAETEAKSLLELLGISNHFNKIYGADFLGDICKPEKDAFEMVLRDIGIEGPQAIFFEDSYKNLVTAKEIDMQCVLVKGGGLTAHEESVDREKEKILDLIVTTLSDVEDQNKIIDLLK